MSWLWPITAEIVRYGLQCNRNASVGIGSKPSASVVEAVATGDRAHCSCLVLVATFHRSTGKVRQSTAQAWQTRRS